MASRAAEMPTHADARAVRLDAPIVESPHQRTWGDDRAAYWLAAPPAWRHLLGSASRAAAALKRLQWTERPCYGRCMHMQRTAQARVRGGVSATWSKVAAFTSAVEASLDRWLAHSHGVGLTEFRALAFVSQAPDKELRVNELADRVGLSQSSATRLLSRLEAKGVARRDVCEDDGRGVYAVITEQGEALLREVADPFEDRIRELLADATLHFPAVNVSQIGGALHEIEGLIAP